MFRLPTVFIVLGCTGAALAHSGDVALAVPLSGITIDGDLSDWPAGMKTYPIDRFRYGSAPTGPDDLSASFRVAYSPAGDVLYVAVEGRDDVAVPDFRGQPWKQDGCEVYVGGHDGEGAAAQYAIHGDRRDALGKGRVADADVMMVREDGAFRYEWRVQLPVGEGRPGQVFAIEVNLWDLDAEDEDATPMSWRAATGSLDGLTGELGDLILIGDGDLAQLGGVVRWRESDDPAARSLVTVEGLETPVHVQTDHLGRFSLQLPAGPYTVNSIGRDPDRVQVDVSPGVEGTVDLVAPAPAGRTIEATGQRRAAGPGIRVGDWRTWGLADGLVPERVSALLQDREGRLWIATGFYGDGRSAGGGATRYDGVDMLRFTEQDGLPANVRGMVEDGDGVLWFATMDGLSRYDGSRFTTFTTADGLLSDDVRAVALDRSNRVWVGTDAGLSGYGGEAFANFTVADGIPPGEVTALLVDGHGTVWAGSATGGLCRMTENGWETVPLPGSPRADVRVLFEHPSGDIWIGSNGGPGGIGGIGRFDGEQWHAVNISPEQGTTRVMAMTLDPRGRLWYSTWGGRRGLLRRRETRDLHGR